MANKIKLGTPPKTFKQTTIKVVLPDGSEGEIPLTFNYLTQDDYWAWREAFVKAVEVKTQDGDETLEQAGDKPALPTIAKEARQRAAKHIIGAIASWELDVALTAESLCQLFNEIPVAAIAIGEAYQIACTQGRLGN